MQARAAVMPEPHGRWTIETLEVAEPGPQEVLVRVVASGICQTDVHARDGFFPIPCPAVYGHEGAGVVERVGSAVTTLQPGDHVIMVNPSCGTCPECLAGFETYCSKAPMLKQSGYRADGTSLSFSRGQEPIYGSFFQQSSFASVTLAMARNTIRVPDEAPLDILAAFPCGVNTGAGAVMNVLKPHPGDSYVAFGTGTVGCAGLLDPLAGQLQVRPVPGLPVQLHQRHLDLGMTGCHDALPRAEHGVDGVGEAPGDAEQAVVPGGAAMRDRRLEEVPRAVELVPVGEVGPAPARLGHRPVRVDVSVGALRRGHQPDRL